MVSALELVASGSLQLALVASSARGECHQFFLSLSFRNQHIYSCRAEVVSFFFNDLLAHAPKFVVSIAVALSWYC